MLLYGNREVSIWLHAVVVWHKRDVFLRYLLFLGLLCFPFPANCFSRHSPTRTGPSPTWRAAATLGSGSYNGDGVCFGGLWAGEAARLIESNRVESDEAESNNRPIPSQWPINDPLDLGRF